MTYSVRSSRYNRKDATTKEGVIPFIRATVDFGEVASTQKVAHPMTQLNKLNPIAHNMDLLMPEQVLKKDISNIMNRYNDKKMPARSSNHNSADETTSEGVIPFIRDTVDASEAASTIVVAPLFNEMTPCQIQSRIAREMRGPWKFDAVMDLVRRYLRIRTEKSGNCYFDLVIRSAATTPSVNWKDHESTLEVIYEDDDQEEMWRVCQCKQVCKYELRMWKEFFRCMIMFRTEHERDIPRPPRNFENLAYWETIRPKPLVMIGNLESRWTVTYEDEVEVSETAKLNSFCRQKVSVETEETLAEYTEDESPPQMWNIDGEEEEWCMPKKFVRVATEDETIFKILLKNEIEDKMNRERIWSLRENPNMSQWFTQYQKQWVREPKKPVLRGMWEDLIPRSYLTAQPPQWKRKNEMFETQGGKEEKRKAKIMADRDKKCMTEIVTARMKSVFEHGRKKSTKRQQPRKHQVDYETQMFEGFMKTGLLDPKLADKVTTTLDRVEQTVLNAEALVNETAERITNQGQILTDETSEVMRMARGTMDSFGLKFDFGMNFIFSRMIDVSGFMREGFSLGRIFETIARLLVDLNVPMNMITQITVALTPYINRVLDASVRQAEMPDTQGFTEDLQAIGEKIIPWASVASGILGGLTILISAIYFKVVPKGDDVEGFVSSTVGKSFDMFRLMQGSVAIEKFYGWFKNMYLQVFAWCMGKSVEELERKSNIKSLTGEMQVWAEQVATFMSPEYQQAIQLDVNLRQQVFAMYDKSQHFASEISAMNANAGIVTIFKTFQKDCFKLYEIARKPLLYATARPDPLCVSVSGPTNIGKSGVMYKLINAIAESQNLPVTNRAFARIASVKHWDGYAGQFAVIQDDFAQVKTSEDVAELFSMKTNAEFTPPMAKIEEKGMKFCSMLVMQSSNVKYPEPVAIVDFPALWRRRDVLIEAKMKVHVAERDPIGHTHLLLRQIDSSSPTGPTGRWMEVRDMEQFLVKKYYNHMVNQKALVENLNAGTKIQMHELIAPNEFPETQMYESDDEYPTVSQIPSPTPSERSWSSDEGWERRGEYDWVDRRNQRLDEADVFYDAEEYIIPITKPIGLIRKIIKNRTQPKCEGYHPFWKTLVQCKRLILNAPLGGRLDYSEECWEFFYAAIEEDKDVVMFCPTLLIPELDNTISYERDLITMCRRHEDITRYFNDDANVSAILANEAAWEIRDRVLKFKNVLSEWYESAKKILKAIIDGVMSCLTPAHWKLFGAIIVMCTGISLTGWFAGWLQRKINPTPAQKKAMKKMKVVENGDDDEVELVERNHEGLTPEKRIRHAHICDCGKVFIHDHIIRTPEENEHYHKTYPNSMRCKACWIPEDTEGSVPSGDEKTAKLQKLNLKTEGSVPSGDEKTAKLAKLKLKTEMAEIEGCNDQNAMDLYTHRIRPAINRIYKGTAWVHYLMIHNRIMLIPAHFTRGLKNGYPVTMMMRGIPHEFEWQMERCTKLVKKTSESGLDCYEDWCLYECPATVPAGGRMLSNAFVSEDDLNKLETTSAMLVTRSMDGEFLLKYVTARLGVETVARDVKVVDGRTESEFYLSAKTWHYDAPTAKGDCGGVLLALNPYTTGKILGMHVGGMKNNTGYSVLITRQMLSQKQMSMTELLPVSGIVYPDVQQTTGEDLHPIPYGERILVTGKCLNGESVHQAEKTTLEPSVIHEMIYPKISEPAVLSKRDPRTPPNWDPLEEGLQKYNVTSRDFPQAILQKVLEHKIEKNKFASIGFKRRILTEDETINGIEGEEFYDRMNMQTSPGWPYTNLRKPGTTGKLGFFEQIPGTDNYRIRDDENGKLLRKRLHDREENAKLGQRVESECTDCLKDERRPLHKVHKTRVFNLMPMCHTMLVRKYFLSYIVWSMRSRRNRPCAIGMNVDSMEWDDMVRKFKRCSPYGFDGDYGKFDSKMRARMIVEYFGNLVNAWYDDGEENARIRQVLLDEVAHTIHRTGNAVFETFQSNKSGVGITSILNSDVNEAYLDVCWLIAMLIASTNEELTQEERELARKSANMASMERNTVKKVYGDDNAVAVSQRYVKMYNAIIVGKILSEFGIEYTPADKGERTEAYVKIEDLQFLKRHIVKHEELDLYLAPIDKEVIEDLTNWVRKSANPERACRENCENSLRYSYQWGRSYFSRHRTLVNQALSTVNIEPIMETFEDYDDMYLNEVY